MTYASLCYEITVSTQKSKTEEKWTIVLRAGEEYRNLPLMLDVRSRNAEDTKQRLHLVPLAGSMKECLAYTWMEKREERERERASEREKWATSKIRVRPANCPVTAYLTFSELDIKTTKRAHTETTWKM